jgi:hypothetical protein
MFNVQCSSVNEWSMDQCSNVLIIDHCSLIIRPIKESYMPSPSLPSLKDKANLVRSYIIAVTKGTV